MGVHMSHSDDFWGDLDDVQALAKSKPPECDLVLGGDCHTDQMPVAGTEWSMLADVSGAASCARRRESAEQIERRHAVQALHDSLCVEERSVDRVCSAP